MVNVGVINMMVWYYDDDEFFMCECIYLIMQQWVWCGDILYNGVNYIMMSFWWCALSTLYLNSMHS